MCMNRADAALTRARAFSLSTEEPALRTSEPKAPLPPTLQFMPKAHREENPSRRASVRVSRGEATDDAMDDIMDVAMDEAMAYARERVTMGSPIINHQVRGQRAARLSGC